MESALLARGFHYGTAPNSVVIGWNGGHTAVTLPDGTPVSSGESNAGVRVGGAGAYQPQFSHHMYLPVQAEEMNADASPPADPPPPADPVAPADPGQQAPVIDLAAGPPPPAEAPDAPLDAPVPAPPADPAPADAPVPVPA